MKASGIITNVTRTVVKKMLLEQILEQMSFEQMELNSGR
jgi:hypothetical protein